MFRGKNTNRAAQIEAHNQSILPEKPQPKFVHDSKMQKAMESLHSHPHISGILNQLWEKDPDTYGHCHRVADLAQAIGAEMGLSYQERVEVYLVGLLHDVGKLFTPDAVLKKPGPLNNDEFGIMKNHPQDSANLVARIPDIDYLVAPIRAHHERIDGRGYPDGLQGDRIPIYSRVVLVADTFDAMTNNRVYRKQIDLGRTYEELDTCSDTQFDRAAAQAFVKMHQRSQQSGERMESLQLDGEVTSKKAA